MTPTLQQKLEPVVQRAPTEAPPESSSSSAGLPRFLQDPAEAAPGDAGVTDAGPAPADAGGGLPGLRVSAGDG